MRATLLVVLLTSALGFVRCVPTTGTFYDYTGGFVDSYWEGSTGTRLVFVLSYCDYMPASPIAGVERYRLDNKSVVQLPASYCQAGTMFNFLVPQSSVPPGSSLFLYQISLCTPSYQGITLYTAPAAYGLTDPANKGFIAAAQGQTAVVQTACDFNDNYHQGCPGSWERCQYRSNVYAPFQWGPYNSVMDNQVNGSSRPKYGGAYLRHNWVSAIMDAQGVLHKLHCHASRNQTMDAHGRTMPPGTLFADNVTDIHLTDDRTPWHYNSPTGVTLNAATESNCPASWEHTRDAWERAMSWSEPLIPLAEGAEQALYWYNNDMSGCEVVDGETGVNYPSSFVPGFVEPVLSIKQIDAEYERWSGPNSHWYDTCVCNDNPPKCEGDGTIFPWYMSVVPGSGAEQAFWPYYNGCGLIYSDETNSCNGALVHGAAYVFTSDTGYPVGPGAQANGMKTVGAKDATGLPWYWSQSTIGNLIIPLSCGKGITGNVNTAVETYFVWQAYWNSVYNAEVLSFGGNQMASTGNYNQNMNNAPWLQVYAVGQVFFGSWSPGAYATWVNDGFFDHAAAVACEVGFSTWAGPADPTADQQAEFSKLSAAWGGTSGGLGQDTVPEPTPNAWASLPPQWTAGTLATTFMSVRRTNTSNHSRWA